MAKKQHIQIWQMAGQSLSNTEYRLQKIEKQHPLTESSHNVKPIATMAEHKTQEAIKQTTANQHHCYVIIIISQ